MAWVSETRNWSSEDNRGSSNGLQLGASSGRVICENMREEERRRRRRADQDETREATEKAAAKSKGIMK